MFLYTYVHRGAHKGCVQEIYVICTYDKAKKKGKKKLRTALAVSKEIAAQFENQKKREAANW